ncbi:hypothetical protein TNCV_695531 [Trichonephila clavipes]|nr:hypothetical protein TNCV_695531 [Trichonephila clavipes]
MKGPDTTPKNLTELWTALANIWQVIPMERFRNLAESMPRVASFCDIARRTDRNLISVTWIWTQSIANSTNERNTGSPRPSIPVNRQDRHRVKSGLKTCTPS